ncbi:alpha/beta hydrolase [Streptomyces sp. NPDC002519]
MRLDDLSPQTPVLEHTVAEFVQRHVCPSVPWGADPGPARAWAASLLTGDALPEDVSEEWLALPNCGDGQRIRVRIVRPVGLDRPLPVALFLHGLGWMLTDATEHGHLIADIALGAEAAVVVPEYDRAPEARYPVAVEQAYAVARWITDHGEERGLDGNRIAVVGASAGANLAAALTLLAKERGGVRLVQQVLLCPVTDAAMDTESYRDFAEGFFLGREAMRHFWHQYVPDPADRFRNTASPLRATDAELAGLPKALIVTAEADVLRDEGEGYAARLRRAGVSVVSVRYHGTVHGFLLFESLRGSDASRAARIQTMDTLHAALHPWPM